MLSTSIFANTITNLTDARYFAAMGVDFIGFELSPDNPEQVDLDFVKRISDWLEGPSIIGSVAGNEPLNQLTKWVVDGALDGLFFHELPGTDVLEAFDTIELFVELKAAQLNDFNHHRIHAVLDVDERPDQWEQYLPQPLRQINQATRIFVKGTFDDAFFNSSLFDLKPGMILKGSEEEKLGFKSFDDLDLLFEKLEIS